MAATTYEIIPETRPGLGKWAIRVIVNGVIQEGTIGAGYETDEEAKYWVGQFGAHDERGT